VRRVDVIGNEGMRKVSMRLCTLKISLQLIQQRVYPQLNQESKRVLKRREMGEWQQRVGIVDANG